MDWRAALTENWAYKIAAFLVVALLWVNLTADERQAQEVPTRVEYEVLDSAWVLVDAPREVRTTFQGRNRQLLGLLVNEPVIHITLAEVSDPVMRLRLDPDLVSYDRRLQVRPTLVLPISVELRFEPLMERRVPVVPDVETLPALGYAVVGPLLVEPESVTVRGAKPVVEEITAVATRRVTLEGLEHAVLRDLPLELPPGVSGVKLEPPSVLVTVPVDSLVVRQVRLPVEARGARRNDLRVDPDTVTAVVRGAAEAVRRQMAGLQEAYVELQRVPSEPISLPVAVDRIEGGFVSITLEPAEVTVRKAP